MNFPVAMADPIVEQNTENSSDISNFKEYQDKIDHLKKKMVKCKSRGCQLLFQMPTDMYQHM